MKIRKKKMDDDRRILNGISIHRILQKGRRKDELSNPSQYPWLEAKREKTWTFNIIPIAMALTYSPFEQKKRD